MCSLLIKDFCGEFFFNLSAKLAHSSVSWMWYLFGSLFNSQELAKQCAYLPISSSFFKLSTLNLCVYKNQMDLKKETKLSNPFESVKTWWSRLFYICPLMENKRRKTLRINIESRRLTCCHSRRLMTQYKATETGHYGNHWQTTLTIYPNKGVN